METVRRGDSWWRRGDDGTWYRWDEAARAWEYAEPDDATAGSVAPLPVSASPASATSAVYHSPRGVARALAALLVAGAVLDLAAVAVFAAEARMWEAAMRGGTVTDAQAAASDVRLGLLGTAIVLVLLATVPLFIVWFHRLYTNLPALGVTQLRFSPGWAIGAWFVPILNLWRPKQIANDIWRASDPDAPTSRVGWRERRVGGVVHLWWGLYLLSSLLSQAVLRSTLEAEAAAELRSNAFLEMGSAGVDALSAAAAAWFVVRLTARQEQRAAPGHQP